MSKIITVKLTKAGKDSGPFTISDQSGNVIESSVSMDTLVNGVNYAVGDDVTSVTITSSTCSASKTKLIGSSISASDLPNLGFTDSTTACLWRHLTDVSLFNNFYGNINPYVIEYPFAYNFNDEILQSVKDYSKVYKYYPDGTNDNSRNDKIELDDAWFNKAIVYNGQQSSGILNLVPKPKNNLKEYLSYPIYSDDSKSIIYTKSDGFYQYNTFWNIVKDKSSPLFDDSCESLSIDKVVNQDNMEYTKRSFRKDPLRSKNLKIRHILDDRSDIHIVSKLITSTNQISYK